MRDAIRLTRFGAFAAVGALAFFSACAQTVVEEDDGKAEGPKVRGSGGSGSASAASTVEGSGGSVSPKTFADAGAVGELRPGDGGATISGDPPAVVPSYRPDPVTMGQNLPNVVPVVWIEVDGKAIESVQKNVELPGRIKIFEEHDNSHADLMTKTPSLMSAISFQGRGNFTFTLPKKGYAFELQDGTGKSVDLPLLGMPKGSDFALYACYTDKTCMRNALVSALGQQLGRWSPRARFVELFFNGKYQGLYMVWERIRHDKDRVVVPKPAPMMATGDVSGGYIFRHEGGGKGSVTVNGMKISRDFSTGPSPVGNVYSYHYPRVEEITAEQKAYLPDYMKKFEAAMKANPAGYRTWVDVPSWIDHAVAEEFTNNWDGYVHSVFMTKQPTAAGGLLGIGPLWDFDLAFANGNVSGYHCRTDNWTYKTVRPWPDNVPTYWLGLFADTEYQKGFKCRWQQLRREALDLVALNARIDTWVKFTADARRRDQVRFPTVGKMIFPNCFSRPTYDDEIVALKDWIAARTKWIDTQVAAMPGACL